jgi:hypothetical protein
MRLTHVSDFAASVARIIDLKTGLVIGKTSFDEHKAQLEREIDLDHVHEKFFGLLGDVMGEKRVDRLQTRTSFNPSTTASVGELIVTLTNSVFLGEPTPGIVHWSRCSIHEDLLCKAFGFYLKCLEGTATSAPECFRHILLCPNMLDSRNTMKMILKWGTLLTSWEKIVALAAALTSVPEQERSNVIRDLMVASTEGSCTSDIEDFCGMLETFTTPIDEDAAN